MALLLPKPKAKKKTSTRSGTEESENPNTGIAKSVSHIDHTLIGFTGLNKKQTKKFQEAQEQYQKDQLKISKETNDGGKDKKTTKKWRKVVDFLFGGLKGFFKAIGRIVASLSLGKVTGILGLLLGLFLMLKLGLLDVVIPAAISLLVTLIKGLIGYLPMIVKFLYKLITQYIPMIINAIADALSDALGIKSKPLRNLVKTLTWIVSLGAGLNKVLGLFGKNIFSLITKAVPFLMANPIVAVILAVAAALALTYKYAEQISDFFDNLWQKFKNLGIVGKIVVMVLTATIAPFIALINLWAKFFKSVKKNGFINTMKAIWDSISSFFSDFSDIWIELKNAFSDIWSQLSGMWSDLKSTFSEIGNIFSELFPSSKDNKNAFTAKKMLEALSLSFKLLFKILKPIVSFFVKIIIVSLKMFFGMIKVMSKPFMLFIKALKEIFELILRIKKEGLKSILSKIWDSIRNFFGNLIKNILKKFQPIADFFTKVGSKIGGFFEPAINKIKKMVASIGDIFSSIIDWIMYKLSFTPLVSSDVRGKASSVEEFKLISYAKSAASEGDTKTRIEEYAAARRKGDKQKLEELSQTMSSSQMALGESMAETAYKNLAEYSKKLNQGGDFLAARTKKFDTPVNNTSYTANGGKING